MNVFVQEGSYSEKLATDRLVCRAGQKSAAAAGATIRIPACPQCGKPTVLRTIRSGKNAGSQFWGCSTYPDRRGAVDL
jgi:restriction system protein